MRLPVHRQVSEQLEFVRCSVEIKERSDSILRGTCTLGIKVSRFRTFHWNQANIFGHSMEYTKTLHQRSVGHRSIAHHFPHRPSLVTGGLSHAT